MRDVVIVGGVRTPVGSFGGSLQNTSVVTLGSIVLKEALKRLGVRPVASDELKSFGGDANKSWSAGLRLFDVSNPAKPHELSFYTTTGRGIHRMWYTGGKYAYLPIVPEGFSNCIFSIFDVSDPKKPEEVSRWWLPGMREGESPSWEEGARCWFHGCVVANKRAHCGWWDAGMIILDISDVSKPKLVSRLDYSPPFGGATHTCLPLPNRKLVIVADEAIADNCEEGQKMIWTVDVREEANPIPVSLFPVPKGDFCEPGARFGPHNLHENRPGSFQSDTIIFKGKRQLIQILPLCNPLIQILLNGYPFSGTTLDSSPVLVPTNKNSQEMYFPISLAIASPG